MAARIIEKYTRPHRRERLQHLHELSRSQRAGGDRLGYLRKTHTFDGRAKHSRNVAGDERARYGNLNRATIFLERP